LIDSTVYSHEYYIDRFFQEGILPIRSETMPNTEGYEISIYWNCVYRPGYNYYAPRGISSIPTLGTGLSPKHGPPAREERLEITSLEKRVFDNTILYAITFELECDLYFGGNHQRGEYYGRLNEGVFRIVTEVPR
jgi:hypothetical protein